MEKRYAVAVVSKPHGIHGEVKLKSLGDNPSSLLDVKKVYTSEDGNDFFKITKAWRYKDIVCVALDGIDSRNDAEDIRGKYLYLDQSDMPRLKEGAHYLRDLIGCTIQDDNGAKLGTLKHVMQHGAADVYVVKGDKNFMIPAIARVIVSVDIVSKVIVVNSQTIDEVIVYDN